ncbi:MAG TPA: methyltransferase domain-containing protein [Epsilonproteobacteria bacterium]|nr:methyltransferase domain-containing protein [Campylobacterota bacterium]
MMQRENKVVNGFSRFAHQYESYNRVQKDVALQLAKMIPSKHYTQIIDLGCGSGQLYRALLKTDVKFSSFTGLDFSPEMLSLHPTANNVFTFQADFNATGFLEPYITSSSILLLSSSALQWSSDLHRTLLHIATKVSEGYFALFTSGTFQTLHKVAGVSSPISSIEEIKNTFQNHFNATFHVKRYELEFPSTEEMFRYIKGSGVSGGEQRLGFQQTKKVLKEYPLGYLEFEVLFVEGKSLIFQG